MSYRGSDNAKAQKSALRFAGVRGLSFDTEPRGGKKSRRITRRVWI